MPVITKKQLKEENEKLRFESALTSRAIRIALSGEWSHKFRGGDYTARLAELTGVSDGLLALTFHPKGQKSHTAVYCADDWAYSFIERFKIAPPSRDNKESQALQNLAYAVRAAINDEWAKVKIKAEVISA